jgi:TPR repeat protein
MATPYADRGCAWAQNCLGSLLMVGLEVEYDPLAAEKYLKAATDQNLGGAWFALGVLYDMGLCNGTPKLAHDCYQKSRDLSYIPGAPLPGYFDD